MQPQQILLMIMELADQLLKRPRLGCHSSKYIIIDAEESRLIVYNSQPVSLELLKVYSNSMSYLKR